MCTCCHVRQQGTFNFDFQELAHVEPNIVRALTLFTRKKENASQPGQTTVAGEWKLLLMNYSRLETVSVVFVPNWFQTQENLITLCKNSVFIESCLQREWNNMCDLMEGSKFIEKLNVNENLLPGRYLKKETNNTKM